MVSSVLAVVLLDHGVDLTSCPVLTLSPPSPDDRRAASLILRLTRWSSPSTLRLFALGFLFGGDPGRLLGAQQLL
jgi:hypothetical protein